MSGAGPGALWPLLSLPATIDPERPALSGGGGTHSYSELQRWAEQISSRLDGSPVALLDVNSDRAIALMYACFHRGVTFVPLNYRLRPPEIAGILSRSELSNLVIGPRYRAVATQAQESWTGSVTELADLCGDGPAAAPEPPEPSSPPATDLADVVLFTSGTSSAPKAIQLEGEELCGYVMASTPACPPETRLESLLMSMPLYHVAGLVAVLRSIFAGRRVTLLEQFEAVRWVSTIERERITQAFVVPTMLQQILDAPNFLESDFSSLETLTYGGGPMPRKTITRALADLPETVGLVGVYGLTEASGTVCVLDEDDHRAARRGDQASLARLSSVGRPLADLAVEVRDAEGSPCSLGEHGEITITGTRISEEASSAAADGKRVLRTGDRGYLDDAGYLFFAGRADDMIVRGGENISPTEIEETLRTAESIKECAVFGMPDESWGQIIVAAVVLGGDSALDRDQLKRECRHMLAGYKWPDRIIEVRELPMNPTGKVIKRELSSMVEELLEVES